MRVLAVDLGTVKIGVAVGESEFEIIAPRPALDAFKVLVKDAEQVAAMAKLEEVDAIVLGLPLQPDGTESSMSKVCRRFAAILEEMGLTVHLQDEAFSSVHAEHTLNQMDLKGSIKKKSRDSVAAASILERYWGGQ